MNWRKYYGQNFLIDVRVAEKIIDISDIKPFEDVCEMGTGEGVLIPYLCKNARFVSSFEVITTYTMKLKFYNQNLTI